MRLALFVLVFVAAVLGQFTTNPGNYRPVQNLDTFTLGEQALLLVTASNTTYPNVQSDIYISTASNDEDLIGGERDLLLHVDYAPSGRNISTNAGSGLWSVNSPQSVSGFFLLQLDGKHNSSTLDLSGFGPRDLTAGGQAQALNATLKTTTQTQFSFFFYNANGDVCSSHVAIPNGYNKRINYYFPYNQFRGDCDFGAITAIEISIEAFSQVGAAITFLGTVGAPQS